MAVARKRVVGLSAAAAALAGVLISHWEGMNLVAKHLPFDPPGVITVCGGITNYDWPWLKVGDVYTKAQCQEALSTVGQRYASDVATECLPELSTYPPHRQASIASFAVNLGKGKICGTSIGRDLREGRVKQACDAMVKYVNANGTFLQGLYNRRTDAMWGERPWCLRED
ncbi:glycoside hydrolase family protein [Bradyrhizobium sp. B124]|uniref:glycoside hydrolase family protein n=1 Tax=Bradyrhizobium sp. B124 TaxID=3140245 RepID=UPI0031838F66